VKEATYTRLGAEERELTDRQILAPTTVWRGVCFDWNAADLAGCFLNCGLRYVIEYAKPRPIQTWLLYCQANMTRWPPLCQMNSLVRNRC